MVLTHTRNRRQPSAPTQIRRFANKPDLVPSPLVRRKTRSVIHTIDTHAFAAGRLASEGAAIVAQRHHSRLQDDLPVVSSRHNLTSVEHQIQQCCLQGDRIQRDHRKGGRYTRVKPAAPRRHCEWARNAPRSALGSRRPRDTRARRLIFRDKAASSSPACSAATVILANRASRFAEFGIPTGAQSALTTDNDNRISEVMQGRDTERPGVCRTALSHPLR